MTLLTLALLSAQGYIALPGPPTDRLVLRSIEVRVGEGEPAKPGQEYTVHYTGWLTDGTKFDSSVDRNTPLKFIQGRRTLIAGWETGFEGMRVGGKRRLFIPYMMAYGEAGRGAIPPRADLIFDVELLAIRDVPPEQAARDLLVALDEYEKKLLGLARAFPEEKLAFRPAENMRPAGEVLAHVALGTHLMLDLAVKPAGEGFADRVKEQWKQEKAPRTKAELLKMLEAAFAAARERMKPLRPAQLNQDIAFFESQTTVRGVYLFLETHYAEHLGQLIVYARMQGIPLPW
jgi:uncharacterized damage-inducible protein DinB